MKKRRSATKKPMFPTRVRSMSLCLSLCLAPRRRAAAPSGPFVRLWALAGRAKGAPASGPPPRAPRLGPQKLRRHGGPLTRRRSFYSFLRGFYVF